MHKAMRLPTPTLLQLLMSQPFVLASVSLLAEMSHCANTDAGECATLHGSAASAVGGENYLQVSHNSQFAASVLKEASSKYVAPVEVYTFVHSRKVGKDFAGSDICWDFKADNPFGVHVNASCPSACPFSQELEGQHCFKACVTEDKCNQIHPARVFANPATMNCEPPCGLDKETMVSGCVECESVGKCSRCMLLHYPGPDGKVCLNTLSSVWVSMYTIIIMGLLILMVYLAYLCCLPNVNTETYKEAMENRKRSRPRKLGQSGEGEKSEWQWKEYPLCCTLVLSDDVAGVGIALYFRWLLFAMFVGTCLLLGAYCAWHVPFTEMEERLAQATDAQPLHLTHPHLIKDSRDCPVEVNSTISVKARFLEYPYTHDIGQKESLQLTQFRPVFRFRNPIKFRPMAGRKTNAKKKAETEEEEDIWNHPAGDLNEYPARMVISMGCVYVLISVISLAFSWMQHRFACHWKDKHPLHQSYAVLATGLPKDVTNPEDLRSFFLELLGTTKFLAPPGEDSPSRDAEKVVGVSIAYNTNTDASHQQLFNQALDGVVDEHFVRAMSQEPAKESATGQDDLATTPRSMPRSPRSDSKAKPSPRDGTSSRLGTPRVRISETLQRQAFFQFFDKKLLPANSQEVTTNELRDVFKEIKSTGVAIVVLSTVTAAQQLLSLEHVKYKTGEEIQLCPVTSEPTDIFWENCNATVSKTTMAAKLAFFPLCIIGFLILYLPYAAHYTVLVNNATGRPGEGHYQDMLLGLCVVAGNQLLSLVSYMIAKEFNFIEKGRHDVVLVSLLFVGTACNMLCDIGTVIYLTRGVGLSKLVYAGHTHDGYDVAVSSELFSLFVPGYILFPYILAPIMEDVIPFFMKRRLIRARHDVSRRQAERALALPEFDICWRYADMLNIIAMCLILLLFTTIYAYFVMIWFLVFLFVIAITDYVRLLRFTTQSFYTSEALSTAFAYWWAVPTGFMGGIAAWWAVGAWPQSIPIPAPLALLVFLPLHCVVYWTLLRLVRHTVQRAPSSDVSYREMCERNFSDGRVYTFFNMNGVQVLRSLLRRADGEKQESQMFGMDVAVPYAKGKTFLQLPAPQALRATR